MELSVKNATIFLMTLLSFGLAISGFQVWVQTNANAMDTSTQFYEEEQVHVNASILDKKFPTLEVENQRTSLNEPFDPLLKAKAYDEQDGDISSTITVYGEVNIHELGEYELRYVVCNSYGLKSEKRIKVLVDA